VLETTYFFTALIVCAKGSIQSAIHSGRTPVRASGAKRVLHHWVGYAAEEEGIGPREGLGGVAV